MESSFFNKQPYLFFFKVLLRKRMILLLWMKAVTSLAQNGSSRELTHFSLAGLQQCLKFTPQPGRFLVYRLTEFIVIIIQRLLTIWLSFNLCKMMKYSLENTFKTKLSQNTGGVERRARREDRGQGRQYHLG